MYIWVCVFHGYFLWLALCSRDDSWLSVLFERVRENSRYKFASFQHSVTLINTHTQITTHTHIYSRAYTVPTPTQTEKSVHLHLCFFRVTDTNEPKISSHAVISHFLWLAARGHGYKCHNHITIGNICSVFSYKFTRVNKHFIGTGYFQKTAS